MQTAKSSPGQRTQHWLQGLLEAEVTGVPRPWPPRTRWHAARPPQLAGYVAERAFSDIQSMTSRIRAGKFIQFYRALMRVPAPSEPQVAMDKRWRLPAKRVAANEYKNTLYDHHRQKHGDRKSRCAI